MIRWLSSFAAGDAARIILGYPTGTNRVRVLRRADAAPAAHDDAQAVLVYEGPDESPIDTGVRNGEAWHYRAFFWNGSAWLSSDPREVTIAASYSGEGDPLTFIRDRLYLGLGVEAARGHVQPRSKAGPANFMPVLLAPPQSDEVPFPVVTIELMNNSPVERGIGETLHDSDFLAGSGEYEDTQGWLERWQLRIMGWTLNPNERSNLRQAINRVIQANLDVFHGAGLDMIEASSSHTEDLESKSASLYATVHEMSFTAPSALAWRYGTIGSVEAFGDGFKESEA